MNLNPLAALWLGINGGTVGVTLLIMAHLRWVTIPELKSRKAWDFEAVRSVVRVYQGRDVNRLFRVTCYFIAGLISLLAPSPRPALRLATAAISLLIVLGVSSELREAITDYRYRREWLQPMTIQPISKGDS